MTTPAPAKKRKLTQLSKKERLAYAQLVEDGHDSVNQLVHRHLPAQILALQALLEEAQSINPSTNELNNQSNNQSDNMIDVESSTTQSANNQSDSNQPLKNDWFNDSWIVQSDNETYLSTRPFNNQSPDQPVLINKSYAWRPKRRAAYVSFRPDLPSIDQLHKRLHLIIRRLVDMFSVMSLSVKCQYSYSINQQSVKIFDSERLRSVTVSTKQSPIISKLTVVQSSILVQFHSYLSCNITNSLNVDCLFD